MYLRTTETLHSLNCLLYLFLDSNVKLSMSPSSLPVSFQQIVRNILPAGKQLDLATQSSLSRKLPCLYIPFPELRKSGRENKRSQTLWFLQSRQEIYCVNVNKTVLKHIYLNWWRMFCYFAECWIKVCVNNVDFLPKRWTHTFIPAIYYAIPIAITIRFKNGLCTHFCHCDCDYDSPLRKRNRNRVINCKGKWTIAVAHLEAITHPLNGLTYFLNFMEFFKKSLK